jgi:hypothetical protein
MEKVNNQSHGQERGDGSWDRRKGTVDLENALFKGHGQTALPCIKEGPVMSYFQKTILYLSRV